jgi:hypothetical protein
MLVTLFLNPVGWVGAFLGISAVSPQRHRQTISGEQAGTAARRDWRHGRRSHGRYLRQSGASRSSRGIELLDNLVNRQMPIMKAWIVAVGSELLTPFRIDTNSLAITERLNAIGYDVRMKFVVGDDVDELAAVFERAFDHIDLVVCTGGLGPTEDDITRDALTRAMGVSDGRRRVDRRPHPSAIRAPRDDDAGDQPASGDGPARGNCRGESSRGLRPGSGSNVRVPMWHCCQARRAR